MKFSKECDQVLRTLGTSVSEVTNRLLNGNVSFADGTTSTIMAPRSGQIGGLLDWIFGVQSVGDLFAANPGGTAMASPGLNTIFVRPAAILNASDRYVGAALFHEVAHLVTGKSDSELMGNLQIGWFRSWISGSDSITEEIEKKCFPK